MDCFGRRVDERESIARPATPATIRSRFRSNEAAYLQLALKLIE